jgi:hypothetical protein
VIVTVAWAVTELFAESVAVAWIVSEVAPSRLFWYVPERQLWFASPIVTMPWSTEK